MRFLSAALACTAIITHTQAAIIEEVDHEDAKQGYLSMGFDKLHGETYETATKGRKIIERFVKREDGSVEMELDNRNTFYSSTLDIGTPEQKVVVLVDTGSSDLWVMGSSNPYCASTGNSEDSEDSFISTSIGSGASATGSGSSASATIDCQKYGTFDAADSSSFSQNSTSFFVSYADSSAASGPWGTDTITFDGVTLNNTSIGVANISNSTIGVFGIGMTVTESTYSGVGLLTSGATPYQYENVPAAMVSQGLIHKNAYSLFLNDADADSGSILFGAVDHSKYSGQLYTLPILKMYKLRSQSVALGFDVTVQGVGLTNGTDSVTVTTTQFPALLDSGTTLMYLPVLLSDLIAQEIGASYSSRLGYYILDCPSDDDPTQIVFDFGGFEIKTNLTNYILSPSSRSTVCYLGIVPITSVYGIFGDAFLVDAYVVYDLENLEISMAQANFKGGSEDIDVITSDVPSATPAPGYSSTWSTAASITSGGNIFTLSSAANSGSGTLSRGTQTASTAGSSRASALLQASTSIGSGTASISSTGASSSNKKNFGEKTEPTSLFFLISSLLCSFFL